MVRAQQVLKGKFLTLQLKNKSKKTRDSFVTLKISSMHIKKWLVSEKFQAPCFHVV